ncbi:MAG TPA: hypothetical protein DDW27_16680 [Bacteroidales bacterium]|nr:hypothetical protein [Bacteroidales bacterium]
MKFTELIKQPEGRRLEFKAKLPAVADIAKTIVAFANDAAWNRVGTKLGPGWHQVERILDYCVEPRLIREIMTEMGWKDRTKFRKKFITPLIEEGIIIMTDPENTTDPRQQYYLTDKGRSLLQQIRGNI